MARDAPDLPARTAAGVWSGLFAGSLAGVVIANSVGEGTLAVAFACVVLVVA